MRTDFILGLILLAKLVSVLTQLFAIVPMAALDSPAALGDPLRFATLDVPTLLSIHLLIIVFKPQSILSGFKFHTQKQLVTVRSELSNNNNP